jgi:hypothetical protein
MGPRIDLDDVEKRKFLTLLGLELDPSAVQPVASPCSQPFKTLLSRVSTGRDTLA